MFGDAFMDQEGVHSSIQELIDDDLHVLDALHRSNGYAVVHRYDHGAVILLHYSF